MSKYTNAERTCHQKHGRGRQNGHLGADVIFLLQRGKRATHDAGPDVDNQRQNNEYQTNKQFVPGRPVVGVLFVVRPIPIYHPCWLWRIRARLGVGHCVDLLCRRFRHARMKLNVFSLARRNLSGFKGTCPPICGRPAELGCRTPENKQRLEDVSNGILSKIVRYRRSS